MYDNTWFYCRYSLTLITYAFLLSYFFTSIAHSILYTATNDKKYRINRNITHLYPFYNKKQALACFFNSFKENGQEGSSVQGDEEKHPPVRPVSQQAEQ